MSIPKHFSSDDLSGSKGFYRLRDDKVAITIGALLVVTILFLAAVHVVSYQLKLGMEQGSLAHKVYHVVNLGQDLSFSETLNQGMLLTCAILFLASGLEVRARVPLFLSVLFGFAMFDDSLLYHERFGSMIMESFQIQSAYGLGGQDIGELIAWSLAGVPILAMGIWAFLGRCHGDENVMRMIALPLAGLFFCFVVLDIIHAIVESAVANLVFVVLEDGGEMIFVAMSLAVSLAVSRNVRKIYRFSGTRACRD